MRISDWSSDVCSSDLIYCAMSSLFLLRILFLLYELRRLYRKNPVTIRDGYRLVRLEHQEQPALSFFSIVFINAADLRQKDNWILQIGRASCRERVCQYV